LPRPRPRPRPTAGLRYDEYEYDERRHPYETPKEGLIDHIIYAISEVLLGANLVSSPVSCHETPGERLFFVIIVHHAQYLDDSVLIKPCNPAIQRNTIVKQRGFLLPFLFLLKAAH
jgi:hypothetical protein